MSIRLADVRDEAKIDRYVKISDITNTYHDFRWGKIAEKSFGHKFYVLLSENAEGVMDGILPFVHIKSWMFGNYMVSMPYFNYGGVCADDKSTQETSGR